MPNSVHAYLGDLLLLIWVAGDAAPQPVEWDAYLVDIRLAAAAAMAVKKPVRFLILSDTSAPNAIQRQAVLKAIGGADNVACVVSSSRMARGIVSLFSWFNVGIECFAPEAIREAFVFLQVQPAQVARIWSEVMLAKKRLSSPRVVAIDVAHPLVSGEADQATGKTGRAPK